MNLKKKKQYFEISWGVAARSLGVVGLHSTQIVADYVDLDLHICRCLCRLHPGHTRRISTELDVDHCTLPHYVVCDIACTLHLSGMAADIC